MGRRGSNIEEDAAGRSSREEEDREEECAN